MLAFTSQAMAVTRGAAAATGQMVICNGNGTMTLYTDAQGAPTSAPHICPDCVASLACFGVPVIGDAPTVVLLVRTPRLAPGQPRLVDVRFGPPTRAPPLFA